MTFSKPNMKYTEMAMWVDNNASLPECDETKLYQYLYHLVLMCAHEVDLFNRFDDYDEFALYCASRLTMKLRNVSKTGAFTPVKSILNYIKSILRPWRADYEHEFHIDDDGTSYIPLGSVDLGDYMVDSISCYDLTAYASMTTYDDVIETVRKHLKQIPVKRRSPEWTNIYISCLLTLLDRIDYATAYALKHKSSDMYTVVNHAFLKSKEREPILFHIDSSKKNYISVLVVEIQHAISAELSYEIGMKVSVSNTIKSLIYNALSERDDD